MHTSQASIVRSQSQKKMEADIYDLPNMSANVTRIEGVLSSLIFIPAFLDREYCNFSKFWNPISYESRIEDSSTDHIS